MAPKLVIRSKKSAIILANKQLGIYKILLDVLMRERKREGGGRDREKEREREGEGERRSE